MRKNRGLTLLEVLIVIFITAMAAGLTLNLFGGTKRAKIKQETEKLIGTIRFAYNDAAYGRRTNRLVFDIGENKYWIESVGELFILKSPESEKNKKEKDKDEEEGASPPQFSELEDTLVKRVKIDDVLKIRDIYIAHQEDILKDGKAFLYFFPNGETEQAVIHLSDKDEEINYSILVNPITGRSKVEPSYVEIEDIRE